MKELPFTFAEDLKGGRASGGTKESGDLRQRKREQERETRGRKEEKKEKGVVGVDRYLRGSPISETITILLPVVAEASGPGR